MTDAELEKFRKEMRQNFLTNPDYQGLSDNNKQYVYEQNALMAMQAVEFRAKARRAAREAERQDFIEKARRYASFMLDTSKER